MKTALPYLILVDDARFFGGIGRHIEIIRNMRRFVGQRVGPRRMISWVIPQALHGTQSSIWADKLLFRHHSRPMNLRNVKRRMILPQSVGNEHPCRSLLRWSNFCLAMNDDYDSIRDG